MGWILDRILFDIYEYVWKRLEYYVISIIFQSVELKLVSWDIFEVRWRFRGLLNWIKLSDNLELISIQLIERLCSRGFWNLTKCRLINASTPQPKYIVWFYIITKALSLTKLSQAHFHPHSLSRHFSIQNNPLILFCSTQNITIFLQTWPVVYKK